MQFFLYILLALLILLVMITIHETGHYIAAKIFQFKVVEFSIGFGPALFSKTKKNGEKFSIRLIPLGGYCAFEAEDENGEISESSYYNEAPWKRIIVLLSGGAFNLITAVLFSFIYILAVGNASPNAIVVHQLTLDAAGQPVAVQLYEGDIIREVNGMQIVQEMVPEYPGARTLVQGPYTFNNLVRDIGPNESV
ncbi:MAG: site-2 protease family protein, partial [Firmicutes bacterium]|nr:site-2 protease family protein [Bacillota bacterium]